MHDLVVLCAHAVTGWHESWLRALGLRTKWDAYLWRALDRPPAMYFAAITLRPGVPDDDLAVVRGAVCDNWQELSLERYGLKVWRTEPWFLRLPGPVSIEYQAAMIGDELEESAGWTTVGIARVLTAKQARTIAAATGG